MPQEKDNFFEKHRKKFIILKNSILKWIKTLVYHLGPPLESPNSLVRHNIYLSD